MGDYRKKLLITSAIVAAAAGAAQADVEMSGDARMGLTSLDGGKTYEFASRARVKFSLSSEADSGVNTQSVLSGSYGNGQFEVKVAYGLRDDDADQYVVCGTFIFGANTLTAFHKKDFSDLEYNGVGILHDLGSGLALSAGFAEKDGSDNLINFGATMSF